MHNATFKILGPAAVLMLTAGCAKLGGQSVAAAGKEQWKMIGRYCTDCHNAGDYAGNLDFEKINPENFAQHADTLEKAVRKLRGHLMPPPKEPHPDEQTRMAFVTWLENALDEAEAGRHAFPAIAPHRLNRREYANAVHDLLALDVEPGEFLPQDEEVAHFDNIAQGLQVSPSFIEQYVIAARTVALQAVGRPDSRPGGTTYKAGPGTQLTHVKGLPLGTTHGDCLTP